MQHYVKYDKQKKMIKQLTLACSHFAARCLSLPFNGLHPGKPCKI